ncbi:MAG: MarR family transcriptional regulator [Acidobacteriaceae bacterium]|nr:MarR family transcriptional regulator [Acidobacteriaceae bacterium]
MPKDVREAYYQDIVRRSGPRYGGFDLLSSLLAIHLIYTCEMYHQATAKYMSDFGLSKSSFNVLMLLKHGPLDGLQLHDLGDLLLVSRANITGLIDHLEQKGYVKRVVDATDRRARYARITRKAELLLDDFLPLHFANVKSLFEELTEDEKQLLVGLLEKVRKSFALHAATCRRGANVEQGTFGD